MANEFKIRKGLIVEGTSGGTVVDVQGSQGQLFSVTDDLSGSIFAVSDISGVPILDVNSSGLSTFNGNITSTGNATFAGNVGIGTTDPLGKLMVREDLAGSPARLIISNGSTVQSGTSARLSFYEGTSERGYIERRRDGSGKIAFVTPADDNPFVWENPSGEIMRINNSNVGIGTTSPLYKLDVSGTFRATGASAIQGRLSVGTSSSSDIDMLRAGGNYITATNASGVLYFRTVNDIRMAITANGNVGIGKTNPSYKLDVSGDIRSTGATRINTNALIGGYIDVTGIINHRSNLKVLNKAATSWITWVTRDTSGSESVINLSNIKDITALGNVGIGVTGPQSKLQVDGGIQMADDTDTASATKVGTMRYRTGTEYAEVTGTELIPQPLDFTDGWNSIGSTTTITADTFVTVASAGGIRKPTFLTVGQVYRLSISGTTTTINNQINNYGNNSNYKSWSGAGAFNFTFTFTATNDGGIYLRLWPGTTEIYSLSVIEVTEEDASYADMCMQTGSATYEWVNILRNTY